MRERAENMREQGEAVPEEMIPIERTDIEKDSYRRDLMMSSLEQKRCDLYGKTEYPADNEDLPPPIKGMQHVIL